MKKTLIFLASFLTITVYGQLCNTTTLEGNLESPSLIITCDFNGDNLNDIIFVDSSGYNLFWKRNNGGNQFSYPIPLAGGTEIKFLKSGDLNNDNYFEILIATSTSLYYVQYTGVSTINLQSILDAPFLHDIRDIEIGDFNNDGYDGFVLGFYKSSTFDLVIDVINNNNGNLSSQNILSRSVGPLSDIAVGDINGDNKLDIATTGYSMYWFKNIGSIGQFSASNTISSATSNYGKIALIDYDNDNNINLINLNNNGELRSYRIDINGNSIYSPVTILSGLPIDTDIWESTVSNGEDVILIKSINELIALKNINNTFTRSSICNINGLSNAALFVNQDGTSHYIYTNITDKKIERINSALSSVEVTSVNRDFICYPNPTSGLLNIDLNGESVKNVKLINAIGQVLVPVKTALNQFDISMFSSGVYQLIAEGNKGELLSKTIVKN